MTALIMFFFVATGNQEARATSAASSNFQSAFFTQRDSSADSSGALFQPQLFTGSTIVPLPIRLPKGTGGLEPRLSIVYNSSRKHGNAGRGWSLELSKIVRSTKYGSDQAQTWSPEEAVYLYGGQELVRVGSQREQDTLGCNALRYYRQVEEYEKILFCDTGDYWVVIGKDGTRKTFGRLADMPTVVEHSEFAGYASKLSYDVTPGDGVDNPVTFEYYLDEVIDLHNLSWRAAYSPYGWADTRGEGLRGGGSAPRLLAIEYTLQNGSPVRTQPWVVEIIWEWILQNRRPSGEGYFSDPFPDHVDWRYGFPLAYDNRISEIRVKEGHAWVIRKYKLSYDADPTTPDEQLSPDSHRSILRSVQEFGDPSTLGPAQRPPITFEYQYNVSPSGGGFSRTGRGYEFPGTGLTGLEFTTGWSSGSRLWKQLVDLNGDGNLDFVNTYRDATGAVKWNVYMGKGGGGFEATTTEWPITRGNGVRAPVNKPIRETLTGSSGSVVTVELIDMNADSRPDLFTGREIYLNQGDHFRVSNWTVNGQPSSFIYTRRYSSELESGTPVLQYRLTEYDLVDVTGDGCPDRVTPTGYYRNLMCNKNALTGFAAFQPWEGGLDLGFVGQENSETFLEFRDGYCLLYELPDPTYTMDEDGDVLDVTYDGGGCIQSIPARWSRETTTTIVSGFVDLNGDGLKDFVDVVGDNNPRVMMGTGKGFMPEVGTTYASDITDDGIGKLFVSRSSNKAGNYPRQQISTFLDLNGDGLLDYVYSYRDHWRVRLNTGHSLQEAVRWDVPNIGISAIQKNNVHSVTNQGDYEVTNFSRVVQPGSTQTPELTVLGSDAGSPRIIFYPNNASSVRPDLLVRIENGRGAMSTLSYTTHNKQINWAGRRLPDVGSVPFPIAVVSSITTDSGYSDTYTTEFSYLDSFYDRKRKLTGFGEVQVLRRNNPTQTGRYERHLFYVGDSNRRLSERGGLIWHDAPALAGRQFAVHSGSISSTTLLGRRDMFTPLLARGMSSDSPLVPREVLPLVRREVFTPYLVRGIACRQGPRRTRCLAGAPLMDHVRRFDIDPVTGRYRWRQVSMAYDEFGNVHKRTNHGEATALRADGFPVDTGDEVTTIITYATNLTSYIVSLPSEVKTCEDEACNTVLRLRRFYYDTSASDCRTRGSSVGVGNLTQECTLIKFETEGETWASNVFSYDGYGNVTRIFEPSGAITHLTYTPGGAFVATQSICVKEGKGSAAACDENGVASGGAVTLTTQHTWLEGLDVEIETVYPNGRRVIIPEQTDAYDQFGRLLARYSTPPNNPAGATVLLERFEYGEGDTPGANFVWHRRYHGPGGQDYLDTYTFFDGLGRPIQKKRTAEGGLWIAVDRRYNRQGQVINETMPYKSAQWLFNPFDFNQYPPSKPVKRFTFDWAGRQTRSWLEGTSFNRWYDTKVTYGLWSTTVINPVGNQKTYIRDGRRRLVNIEELDGGRSRKVTYHYDRVGNLDWYEDQSGNRTSMFYDSRGLMRRLEDENLSNCRGSAANCPRTFKYDKAGRLIRHIDAENTIVEFFRDELGRIYQKKWLGANLPEPRGGVRFDYDLGANGLTHLASITRSKDNTVSYVYDNWGRPRHKTRTVGNLSLTTSQTYDRLGRVTSLSYPQPIPRLVRERVDYIYGDNGLLSRVILTDCCTPPPSRNVPRSRDIVVNVTYDASGRPTRIKWGNGVETTATYNQMQKLRTSSVFDGTSYLAQMFHNYYANGDIKSIADISGDWERMFTYDYADRLKGVTQNTISQNGQGALTRSADRSWNFSYSANGNMLSKNAFSYQYSGVGAGPHAVTRVGARHYQYDANGAMISVTTSSGTYQYDYDFEGRITYASQNSTTFTYDGIGERVRKQWTVGTRLFDLHYFGPHFEVLTENGTPNYERYVLMGGQRIAYITDKHPGKTFYLHPNYLGSVSLITDETGANYYRRRYMPYGARHLESGVDTGLRYGFTGREEDGNFIYLGVRQYDPSIARMTQPDTIVPDGLNPQSLNRYTYAYNNPIRYVDPTGFQGEPADQEIQEWLSEMIDQQWRESRDEYEIREGEVTAEYITERDSSGNYNDAWAEAVADRESDNWHTEVRVHWYTPWGVEIGFSEHTLRVRFGVSTPSIGVVGYPMKGYDSSVGVFAEGGVSLGPVTPGEVDAWAGASYDPEAGWEPGGAVGPTLGFQTAGYGKGEAEWTGSGAVGIDFVLNDIDMIRANQAAWWLNIRSRNRVTMRKDPFAWGPRGGRVYKRRY
jgi:RHS repeat-associated protein